MSETGSPIIDIGDPGEYERLVMQADVPVVVDFFAGWCAPCAAVEPVIERLARKHAPAVRFARVDTDRVQEVAAAMHVRSVPTLALIWKGRVRDVMIGARSESHIDRRIQWLRDVAEGRRLFARIFRRWRRRRPWARRSGA